MNTKTVKTLADINLLGAKVELERTDNHITGLVITDIVPGKNGAPPAQLIVRKGEYGGIHVLVPVPPPTVTKFRITGELRGLKYDETFATREEAAARLTVITDAAYIGSMSEEIKEVEVPGEEASA